MYQNTQKIRCNIVRFTILCKVEKQKEYSYEDID